MNGGQAMTNQKPKKTKSEKSSDDDIEIKGNVSDGIIVHGDGNVINVIEAQDPSDPPKKKPAHRKPRAAKISPAIIVALIGVIGTIVVALINVFGKELLVAPSPTPVPTTAIPFTETNTPTLVPTDTVTPTTPTSTPIPATDTSVPTFTPIPPVAIGKDWLAGCISTLWKAYPSNISTTERGDGCWREPVHVFSAENGDLDFLAERGRGTSEIYGLFAPLPESGTVTFTVRLRDLNNADLWMGVFAEPDVTSQGLLMTILNGNVNKRAIVQKDPSTYETVQGTVALSQGNGFSISFTFTTLSARSKVNPSVFVTNPVSILSTQKWLFLGYKGLNGAYRIEGTFLNFELK